LKTNYQILIFFGTNIPDTTCHQNDSIVSHFTQCMLLHYVGKADQAKYGVKINRKLENISNIIDCTLNKD